MVIYNMFSGRQPVFLGEAYKFSPNPLHKTSFPDYVPRNIPTHEKPIPRVEYPYKNMRFDHLRAFYIPQTKFDHPYAKYLKIDPVKKEHETTEVEHLGIKAEMETKSGPNEAKLEMGLGKKDGVKEFAIKNLQEERGTENTLTRHRDEAIREDITVLPFEEQYLKFLNEKKELRETVNKDKKELSVAQEQNKPLHKKIDLINNARNIDGKSKTEMINKIKTKLIPEKPISSGEHVFFKKKTVVRPIVPPTPPATTPPPSVPPAPPATTATLPAPITPPPAPLSKKDKRRQKRLEPFVEEKVNDIEKRTLGDDDTGLDLTDIHISELKDLQTDLKGLKGSDNIPENVKQKVIQLGILKVNSRIKVKGLQDILNRNIKKQR